MVEQGRTCIQASYGQGVIPDSIFLGGVGSEGRLCCPGNTKISTRTFALNFYVAMPEEKCYNKYGRTGNLAVEKRHYRKGDLNGAQS